ncbi:hypothetical protein MKW98_021708 [Papaver atlanticum]|uniref:glucomannan 4-beta-mannosyltransferase n=1 Tax=Papaver atlanticum TaxID=357466 RepID=A0AAD4XES1_9MAGN|nr:hypothetical protein MKW98_021708 [Papaver atlanticum]
MDPSMEWVQLATSFVQENVHILSISDVIDAFRMVWELFRSSCVVPVLRICVYICLTMTILLFIDRVYMSAIIFYVKSRGLKPQKIYKWEEIEDDHDVDVEKGHDLDLDHHHHSDDEHDHGHHSDHDHGHHSDHDHGHDSDHSDHSHRSHHSHHSHHSPACGLSWPSRRIIIQVLDDSTDPIIKDSVEIECKKWKSKGINIKYEIRDNRNGYKAGALAEGLKHQYVRQCNLVAMFDADFRPEPDFLHRTIPYFKNNPEIGLVQARWTFVNSDECIMTRIQEMSLNYHFKVEQEVGSFAYAFFGFNGTAGVWRLSALQDAGGWKDRTTVEDMDLSVRACLKGWKFVFVGDVTVKNELPSTFKALRYQQHRWSCGPANLFRKMAKEIITSKTVSIRQKLHLLYSFFFVGKVVVHIGTFFFYCIVIPTAVLVPEVEIPKWGLVYIPTIITLLNAIETPRSFYLVFNWILFENVMSMHRSKGTLVGLFEAGRVNEWVVTEKLGDALLKSRENTNRLATKSSKVSLLSRIRERFYAMELCVGAYIFLCACYDVAFGRYWYFIYLFGQAIAFFIAGLGYVGNRVPNSWD